MADQEKTKIVALEPVTKAVEDLLKAIVQKGQAEVERVSSSAEVLQLTAQYQPCMLIACLTENGQVPDRVNMLKRLETPLKKGFVKTMFTNTLKNSQIGNVITALGVTDFIQEPVPLRTMQFKANLQLKAVETIRKAEERRKAGEEKIVFKKSDAAAKDNGGPAQGGNAKIKPALQLKEDAFLFKNSGVKKLGKKFVLEMEGPAPETGEWKQHEDKGNAQTSWRWVPKAEEGQAPADNGDGWIHTGDKPEFKEASGKWQLASEKPELAYQQNGQKIAKKVSVDENGEVNVAADSPAAAEAVEIGRAIAKAKREKARAKAEALRTDPPKKEKPAAEAGPAPAAAEEAETKKESPALAMLKRLQQGDKSRRGEAEESNASADEPEVLESPATEAGAEEEGGPAALKTSAREEKKKAALSPLEFLKKKKDAGSKAEAAEAPAEEEGQGAEEAKRALEKAARGKPTREKATEEENDEAPAEKEARSTQKSLDVLARLKNRLGTESEEAAEGEEEASPSLSGEAAEESTSDAEGGEELIGSPGRGSRRKKERVEEAARLKAVKSPSGEESPEESAEKPRTRRDVLAEIQERINSPLPEEMPAEEEARLRKKFGLEDKPEVKPKDLARKERLEAIKKLKDLLEKNAGKPDFEEEAPPEPKVHDLSDETINTHSQSGPLGERRESLLRAFDTEESSPAEEDSPAALKKKRREEGGEEKAALYTDEANYLPVASITPLGNAWESTGAHYVYLASEVRYRGFDKMEDLLPLWIFGGKKVPELLDKSQQWRFYGPLPSPAKTLADIPRPVRDYLLALRDQVRKEEGDSPAAAQERAELAALNAKEDARAEVEAETRKKAKAPTQADGLEELFEKKKAGASSAQSALDLLKNRLGKDEAAEGEDFSAAEEAPEAGELSAELSGPAGSVTLNREDSSAPEEEAAREDKNRGDLQSRLDSLKNRLGSEDAAEDQDLKESAAAAAELGILGEEEAERPERTQEEGESFEAARKKAAPAESLPEHSLDKLKSSSPSIEKFLERRKAKAAAAADAAPAATAAGKAADSPGRNAAYLGIYVALSNAFGASEHWERAVGRVLKSMQLSFGACDVALLRPVTPDEQGYYLVDQVSGTALAAGERVQLSDGFSAPISSSEAGREGEILGYLFLKATDGRELFSSAEEAAATKAASLLWPVLKAANEQSGEKGEAA